MGSLVAQIAGPVLSTVGGLIGGSKASQAANQQATAFRDAATYARDQAAFQPFGITTGFGSSQFGIDPTTGRVSSAGYTLDPRLQGVQNQLAGQFGNINLNPDVSQFQTGANQAFGAGTSLFNLGNQYTSISPQQAQEQYITNTQALLAAGRERDRAATANQVFRTGRTGLATGGTTTGQLQSNPEYAALYNARAQQDLDIAQRAQAEGRANQLFGANLYTTGAGLNRSGASMLESIPAYQTSAYNPLRASLGLFSDVERLGMQPFELSTNLGRTVADAGARQGEFVLSGERAAAPSSLAYSSYSPFAQTLQSAGQAISSMGGGGSTSNWFDNLITANRYGTNVGSQQTRMLAEQDRGLF
jgi:hypothetical protein